MTTAERFPCIHRGPAVRRARCASCGERGQLVDVHACAVHGECTLRNHKLMRERKPPACVSCDQIDPDGTGPQPAVAQRPARAPRFSPLSHRPALCTDSHGRTADVFENVLRGGAVFLVCGGPSVNTLDLSLLSQRGIVVATVNQTAATLNCEGGGPRPPGEPATPIRPRFAFFGDSPAKFHPAIWMDGGIAKFVRRSTEDAKITLAWERRGDVWRPTRRGRSAREYPNVWIWEPTPTFRPEEFLWLPRVAWGRHGDTGAAGSGNNIMLPALRLLHWLGARTVYLLGCDFHMPVVHSYAHGERKCAVAAATNNDTYRKLDAWFAELRPHFEAADFRVVNCTPGSRLEAFERLDYNSAVASVTQGIPAVETVRGMYMLR